MASDITNYNGRSGVRVSGGPLGGGGIRAMAPQGQLPGANMYFPPNRGGAPWTRLGP